MRKRFLIVLSVSILAFLFAVQAEADIWPSCAPGDYPVCYHNKGCTHVIEPVPKGEGGEFLVGLEDRDDDGSIGGGNCGGGPCQNEIEFNKPAHYEPFEVVALWWRMHDHEASVLYNLFIHDVNTGWEEVQSGEGVHTSGESCTEGCSLNGARSHPLGDQGCPDPLPDPHCSEEFREHWPCALSFDEHIWTTATPRTIDAVKLEFYGDNAHIHIGEFSWVLEEPPVETLPCLDVFPTVLNFTATEGGVNPVAQESVIRNTGGGTLVWHSTVSDSWIVHTPPNGTNTPAIMFIHPDITGLTIAGSPYAGSVTVLCPTCQLGCRSQTISIGLVVNPPPTGTIAGRVWNDLNGNGVEDPGDFNKSGVRVSWSGLDFGNTTTSPFTSPDLRVGPYTVTVDPSAGWSLTGSSCGGAASCNVNVSDGVTTNVWFGIWNNPSGWFQARNGDVYGRSVNMLLPPDPPGTEAGFGRWFLDAEPNNAAGGVVITRGAASVSDNRVSRRPDGSTPGWMLAGYGSIPWPAELDAIDASHPGVVSGDIIYAANIEINAANVASFAGKIVVAGTLLTVKDDVDRVDAVLISKDSVSIEDRGVSDDTLTINGALYARGLITVAGELSSNRKPALLVNYDPSYLLQNIPGLTKYKISWKEVKSP